MNATAHFSNRASLPIAHTDTTAGKKPWIHIVPKGRFPGVAVVPAGAKIKGYEGTFDEPTAIETVTEYNAELLAALVQSFEGDVLVDYEHFSHDPNKPTDAAGWGSAVRVSADGIELEVDWADPAKEKIQQKVYRYISPEFSGDVRFEDDEFKFYPEALTGAGLTNRPKLKALRPVSANRETTTPPTDMKAKQWLCSILGISADTPDDQLEAKVTAFQTELTDLRKEAKSGKDAAAENETLRTEQMNRDLERFADVIDDKEAAKALLSLNREKAVKVFEGLQSKLKPEPRTPLFQKNRATPPNGQQHFEEGEDADEKATAHFRAVEARAHTIVRERGLSWTQAFDAAKAELN